MWKQIDKRVCLTGVLLQPRQCSTAFVLHLLGLSSPVYWFAFSTVVARWSAVKKVMHGQLKLLKSWITLMGNEVVWLGDPLIILNTLGHSFGMSSYYIYATHLQWRGKINFNVQIFVISLRGTSTSIIFLFCSILAIPWINLEISRTTCSFQSITRQRDVPLKKIVFRTWLRRAIQLKHR